MLSPISKILLFAAILFCLFINLKCDNTDEEADYGDEDDALDDCDYQIDFKTFKKSKKLDLCSALVNSSVKSRIQLQIFANYTEEKIHLRAITLSSTDLKITKSLITLTTDIIENLKHPTSLLKIDDFQILSVATLQNILFPLINTDLKLLGKNLEKTLVVVKGAHKQLLSCSGTFYPKQVAKTLNITSAFVKPIACSKEPQTDKFFTLQEKIYLNQADQKNFRLANIHQDDQKKISRTTWYTCNNPASCTVGLQNKKMLDKTVNYVLKVLQKARIEKKAASG